MDIGCTYPTPEHTSAFLATCKQLGLTTIAFRGLVDVPSLRAIEEQSRSVHNHPLKCLRRADIRLSGQDPLGTLAKKLTVSAAAELNNNNNSSAKLVSSSYSAADRATKKECAYEDADLLVIHLDPTTSDVSILGDNDFGKLLLASQDDVTKRRGPGARLIVINLDCFIVGNASTGAGTPASSLLASATPASAKTFALCKSLSKCNDVVFELSYLPWVRAHARGAELFSVPREVMDAYDATMDAIMSQQAPTDRATAANLPPPPLAPQSMIQSIRNTSQDIVAAYMKPLLLSSGQIKAASLDVTSPTSSGSPTAASSSSSSTSIASDLLFMRAPRDIYALAGVLTQLRRPLLEQGLAVMRRLKNFDEKSVSAVVGSSADKQQPKGAQKAPYSTTRSAAVVNGKRAREE